MGCLILALRQSTLNTAARRTSQSAHQIRSLCWKPFLTPHLFAKQKSWQRPRRPGSPRPTLQPLSSSSKLSLSHHSGLLQACPCPGPGPSSARNAPPPDSCQVNSVQIASFKGGLPLPPIKNDPFLRATTPPTVVSSSKSHRRISSSPFYKCFLNILISQPTRAASFHPESPNILWWDPGQWIQVLTVSGFYSKMLPMTYVVTGCACMCAKSPQWWLTPATPWTVAQQTLLSMGFSRQEFWRGLPCLPPGDLPQLRIEPESFMSPESAGGFFTAEPPGSPLSRCKEINIGEHSSRGISNI